MTFAASRSAHHSDLDSASVELMLTRHHPQTGPAAGDYGAGRPPSRRLEHHRTTRTIATDPVPTTRPRRACSVCATPSGWGGPCLHAMESSIAQLPGVPAERDWLRRRRFDDSIRRKYDEGCRFPSSQTINSLRRQRMSRASSRHDTAPHVMSGQVVRRSRGARPPAALQAAAAGTAVSGRRTHAGGPARSLCVVGPGCPRTGRAANRCRHVIASALPRAGVDGRCGPEAEPTSISVHVVPQ